MKINSSNYNFVDFKNSRVSNNEDNTFSGIMSDNSIKEEGFGDEKFKLYDAEKPLCGRLKTNLDIGEGEAKVFKPFSYDEKNPSLFVKGTNVDGTKFEKLVYINDINPKNMNFVEALAIEGYQAINDPYSDEKFSGRIGLVASQPMTDYFENEDYLSSFSALVGRQFESRNWSVYSIFSKDLNLLNSLLK